MSRLVPSRFLDAFSPGGARSFQAVRLALAAVALAVAAALAAAGCGADQAIVGGSCARGYVQCGEHCVNLATDPDNCGACGNACPESLSCVAQDCVGPLPDSAVEGSTESGGVDESSVSETRSTDAPAADAPRADAAAPDAPSVDATTADSPATDATATDAPQSDGLAPDTGAEGPSRDSGADVTTAEGGLDADAAQCLAPTIYCAALCLDPTSDPFNCGGCGVTCFSGICQNSRCLDATNGAIVFIGHDYEGGASAAQDRVLANAVLLPQNMPMVRVLSYERYANAAAIGNVKTILASAGRQSGRTVALTETTTDSDVSSGLTIAKYDVLLVPDQRSANRGDLATLGSSWQTTVGTFTQAGGVVVVLDGDTGIGEMPQFTTATGLLSVSAQSPVATGTALRVVFLADAVASGVGTAYAAGSRSTSIMTEPNMGNVVYVVATPPSDASASQPVVVHKVF